MDLDEDIRETEERLLELRGKGKADASIRELEAALAYLRALKDEIARHGTDNMGQGKDLKGF